MTEMITTKKKTTQEASTVLRAIEYGILKT
jgi:hypothetical protein